MEGPNGLTLAAWTSPSSSFWVPCSRHWSASVSAGSDVVECGVVEVAKPKCARQLGCQMDLTGSLASLELTLV